MTAMPMHTERLRLVPSTPEEVRAQIARMDARDKAELSAEWLARLDAATTIDPWALGFTIVGGAQVRVVRAHTVEKASASARVLERCSFRSCGQVMEPGDGLVWRWEITK